MISPMSFSMIGRPAGVDQVDLGRLGIDADDLVAVLGQAAGGDGADIAQAQDADLHRLSMRESS